MLPRDSTHLAIAYFFFNFESCGNLCFLHRRPESVLRSSTRETAVKIHQPVGQEPGAHWPFVDPTASTAKQAEHRLEFSSGASKPVATNFPAALILVKGSDGPLGKLFLFGF